MSTIRLRGESFLGERCTLAARGDSEFAIFQTAMMGQSFDGRAIGA